MTVKIRTYDSKDKSSIVVLMKSFGEYLNALDPTQRTHYVPGGARFFTEKLIKDAATKEGSIFVAECNENIIGFIGGYIHRQQKRN